MSITHAICHNIQREINLSTYTTCTIRTKYCVQVTFKNYGGIFSKGVGEGGRGHVPPHFQKWGAQVGYSPPTHTSLFAHILWLKTQFVQNFLRSTTLINQYFLNSRIIFHIFFFNCLTIYTYIYQLL